mmetsp:Transcript_12222/g.22103  ORF Transcript_12222/g.22103 Transcript_12222/m.22103 type:complete len:245 (-) Transcript_12222:1428-2162(-)
MEMNIVLCLILCSVLSVILSLTICLLQYSLQIRNRRRNLLTKRQDQLHKLVSSVRDDSKSPSVIMVVLGSGGHTAEMLQYMNEILVDSQMRSKVTHVVYIVAKSDTHSSEKALHLHASLDCLKSIQVSIEVVPRAREVGQSWITSVFTTSLAAFSSFLLVLNYRPHILLCNGPGTCVPFIASVVVLCACGRMPRCSTIYIESVARVHSLSLSALLVYTIVDRFLVQWIDLIDRYPLSEYYGRLS